MRLTKVPFTTSSRRSPRPGLSLTELLACIAAVSAGLLLGAHYLQLDLRGLTTSAIRDSQVIDQLPEQIRSAIPAEIKEQTEGPTPEQVAADLRKELDQLRLAVAELATQAANPSEIDELLIENPNDPSYIARRDATVVYWSELAEIIQDVNNLQRQSEGSVNEQTVWRVLEVHRRALAWGERAIRAAANNQADPQASSFGEVLANWFGRRAELYSQAMGMWESQGEAVSGEAADQALAKTRQQYENESVLLAERGQRLCEVLQRRYATKFAAPEL